MNAHVKIVVNLGNDAFEDGRTTQEVARILREQADRIEGHPHFSPGHDSAIYDANGNEVGWCGVYEGEVKI